MESMCRKCSIKDCPYREEEYLYEKHEKQTSEKLIELNAKKNKPLSITRIMNQDEDVDIISVYYDETLITKKIGRNKRLSDNLLYLDYSQTNYLCGYSFESLSVKEYRYSIKTIPQGALAYNVRVSCHYIGDLYLDKKITLKNNTILIFRGNSVFSYDEETKKVKSVGKCEPKRGKIYLFENYLQDSLIKGKYSIYAFNDKILLVRNGNKVTTHVLFELKLKSSIFIKGGKK